MEWKYEQYWDPERRRFIRRGILCPRPDDKLITPAQRRRLGQFSYFLEDCKMALRLQGMLPGSKRPWGQPTWLGYCPIDEYDQCTRAVGWWKRRVDENNREMSERHRKMRVDRLVEEQEHGPDTGTDIPARSEHHYQCAWLTKSGRWIGVEYAGHQHKLEELFGAQVTYSEIESKGWVHVGGCNDQDCPRYDGNPLSPAQIAKLRKFNYNPERERIRRYA